MKRYLPSLTIILFSVLTAFAQVPKGINYQGVARDNNGKPYASKSISVRIGILKNVAGGDVEYSETHTLQTNQFGLFTLVIGQGTKVTGDFALISWAVGTKWLQIEIDPAGGNTFTLAGSQQLMTVPYAFYAESSGNSGSGLTAGSGIAINSGVISNTGDADNSITNELQNLTDVLTKSNNAGGIKITNLGAPVAATDAVTKSYVDSQNTSQNLSTILTNGNDAGAKQIKNLAAPIDLNDAATKSYVDAQNALDLDKDPTNELQNLSQVLSKGSDAGGSKITNVGAPTSTNDATNKIYVDNALARNFAFKIGYDFKNTTGGLLINQTITFLATPDFDSFGVITPNKFTAQDNGIYVFVVEGTYKTSTLLSAILSLKISGVAALSYVAMPGVAGNVSYNSTFMVKLTAGQTVTIFSEVIASDGQFTGTFFGYKL